MARFRPRTSFKLVTHLREGHRQLVPAWKREELRLSGELEARWSTLRGHCADQSSHVRLGRLIHRLTHADSGVQESALAELELAVQLIRVGTRLTFLPESQARTADLECHLGGRRFFVEVTAMVGSADRRRVPLRRVLPEDERAEEEDRGVVLIHRILARIRQKAKQLADYCDPVVLHVSIPRADLGGGHKRREEIWLDLKALSGAVTVSLTAVRHVSAVLLSLWDVHPLPSRSTTRLANVDVIERSRLQRIHPRVRMLIQNPAASASLWERQLDAIRETL